MEVQCTQEILEVFWWVVWQPPGFPERVLQELDAGIYESLALKNTGVWCNGSALWSPKPPVRVRILPLLQEIEVWCNGSTTDFDSVSLGSSPDTLTRNMSGCPRGLGSGLQNRLHWFESSTRLKCPRGVMDSTPDYGSVSEGSSPSGDTSGIIFVINTV